MLPGPLPSVRQVALCALVCWGCLSGAAIAQDFRVVTTVSQRAVDEPGWRNISRIITVFHAGKVYDSMESIGEIVIVEPTENQVVILSVNGNNLATSVHFSELQRFLKVARSEMEDHLGELKSHGPRSAQRMRTLQFQLHPEFEEKYDPVTKTLSLVSPMLRYETETESVDRSLVIDQYLEYADWAARLNYVIHSGALFPEPRLALNQALRKRRLLPTEVRLLLDGSVPLQFKAEHKFEWSLGTIDRSMIRRCEQDRDSEVTRWVSFREYQRLHTTDTALH